MMLRLTGLLAAAVIIPGLALADEIVGAGAKTDETSRDSPYINDATRATDPSAASAERAKDTGGDAHPTAHVRPIHRVLLRKSHGVITTTDVYVLPDTVPPGQEPLY